MKGLLIILLALTGLLSFPAAAQKNGKNARLKDFVPVDTTVAVKENRLIFTNLNKVPFYNDPARLSMINKYKRDGDWQHLYPLLLDYISRFGIDNFIDDNSMNMVWELAQVSEKLGKIELTKEVYRLLLKHYREHYLGDMQKAMRYYDSLTRFEKDLYVDLDKYYSLVELRKHIDTLQPPHGVLLNMGTEINSKFEDYGMTLSRDSQTLIFTSKRNRNLGKTRDINPGVNEDIFIAKRMEGDVWEAARPFTAINTRFNEGSPCITDDGKTIIFARCYSPDGFGNCDLYMSTQVNDTTWTEPENLGDYINSYAWESHPSLSITEDTLFFASDRKGGFGGTDIYFSVKNRWGEWSKAKNIGPVINTQNNEVSPFIHREHNVLYFSSDGQLINFGDFDIYKAYSNDGEWTEPKNIGPLVNGKGSEFYFAIDSRSEKLFYARSDKPTKKSKDSKPKEDHNLDLHSFPLPMEAQPLAKVRFSGKVTEETTGEVFEGMVSLIDLDTRIEIAPKYLREDGSFEFDLINHKRYMLIVQGENFFRIEEVFFMDGDQSVNVKTRSIKTITFKSLEFENGSASLRPEMENDLHLVINFLVDHPNFHLKISGHTDSDGDAEANLKLSQKRADVIRNYIIAYGKLDESRVQAIGMGNKAPIVVPEVTETDKRINRRVEFDIFKVGGDKEKAAEDETKPDGELQEIEIKDDQ